MSRLSVCCSNIMIPWVLKKKRITTKHSVLRQENKCVCVCVCVCVCARALLATHCRGAARMTSLQKPEPNPDLTSIDLARQGVSGRLFPPRTAVIVTQGLASKTKTSVCLARPSCGSLFFHKLMKDIKSSFEPIRGSLSCWWTLSEVMDSSCAAWVLNPWPAAQLVFGNPIKTLKKVSVLPGGSNVWWDDLVESVARSRGDVIFIGGGAETGPG